MESRNYTGISIAAPHRKPIDINGSDQHGVDPKTLLLNNWKVLCEEGGLRTSPELSNFLELSLAVLVTSDRNFETCARALSPFHQLHFRIIQTHPKLRFDRRTFVVKSL
jgi:hypothetical protein